MNFDSLTNNARPITIIALVQALMVILGFFTLGILMKIQGYPRGVFVDWNPDAVWLRHYGWLLLLVPAVWAAVSLRWERQSPHAISRRIHIMTGAPLALAIFFIFMVSGLNPFSRPLIMKVRNPSPSEKIAKRFSAVEEPPPAETTDR